MLHPVASSRVRTQARPALAVSLAALLCAACARLRTGLPGVNGPDRNRRARIYRASSITQQQLSPVTPAAAKVAAADIEVSAPVATTIRKARDLRTAGKKSEAMELLDKAAGADKDPALIGERGLLALELGQVDKAVTLLARAQNAAKPDWRMQSAYGAALSAAGRQKEAQDHFNKALAAAPGQPSILNNLASAMHSKAARTKQRRRSAGCLAERRSTGAPEPRSRPRVEWKNRRSPCHHHSDTSAG